MAAYTALLFALSLSGILLAAAVFVHARDRKAGAALALFNTFFSIWCFGQFMGEVSVSEGAVLFWTRVNLAAAVFLPAAFLHFVLAFLGKSSANSFRIKAGYLAALALSAFIPTKYFITGLNSISSFRHYPGAGPAYALFAAFFVLLVGAGFVELFKSYRSEKGAKKNQISYIILASAFGFGGGAAMFAPAFGMAISPWGILPVAFYPFIAAYALVFHRLLDINIFFRKGLIYTILAGLFSGVYLLSALSAWVIFSRTSGINSLLPAAAALFIFSAAFEPLRARVQSAVDRVFFKGRVDHRAALEMLSLSISSILDSRELAGTAAEGIAGVFSAEFCAVYLAPEDGARFLHSGQKGPAPLLREDYPADHPFPSAIECAALEDLDDGVLKEELCLGGVSVLVPVRSGSRPAGFICAGKKKGAGMWNGEDIGLLKAFSVNLAVAADRARLHRGAVHAEAALLQAQTVRELAAKTAHEIKNPLALISPLVEDITCNYGDREARERFLSTVPGQLKSINRSVDSLIRLSQMKAATAPGAPKARVDIAEVLDEIMLLMKAKCERRGIRLEKQLSSRLVVNAVREGIKDLLLNLVMNAVDATDRGGRVRVEVGQGKVAVKDSGHGIRSEDRGRIFEPSYTTRENGSGIGLCIARDIVSDAGGTITVESEPGEGSVFTVDLSNAARGEEKTK